MVSSLAFELMSLLGLIFAHAYMINMLYLEYHEI